MDEEEDAGATNNETLVRQMSYRVGSPCSDSSCCTAWQRADPNRHRNRLIYAPRRIRDALLSGRPDEDTILQCANIPVKQDTDRKSGRDIRVSMVTQRPLAILS